MEATDERGNPFWLSSLEGKNIILIYDGLSCANPESLTYLKQLYKSAPKNELEIVAYCLASSLEKLQEDRSRFKDLPGVMISDFKMDHTPFKIQYGAQIRPTIFVIDKTGKMILRTRGREMIKDMDKIRSRLVN